MYTIPKKVGKAFDSIIYKFVWKGPDRISRKAMISDEDRSLKLVETGIMNNIHALEWIRKHSQSDHPWTDFFGHEQEDILEDVNRATADPISHRISLDFNKHIVTAGREIQAEFNSCKYRDNSIISDSKLFLDRRRKRVSIPY
jgi:hypothetical protein